MPGGGILMRARSLAKNTVSSLIFQICTIVCGFILPRLILKSFGSEVNGLVNSITEFLGIISFLELGVGAVVQSSLFKPLATRDNEEISKIVESAQKFFRILAMILAIYVGILIFIYPILVNQSFGFGYVAILILAMSISSFAQYYFGVVNRLLLVADQHGYVVYSIQTVVIILNTLACFGLIRLNASIQLVKLTTSVIYLAAPVLMSSYINRYYKIDKKIKYVGEPINGKWNGVAQHVAAVVLNGTDNIVLSIFTSFSMVSIYSVYHLVLNGVKNLMISMTNGIHSLLGELWAKQENEKLRKYFEWSEWIIHTSTTFVFSVTAILIVPFVSVYTKGVKDADYVQPLFALLITAASAAVCYRLPYSIMILASGHYKQTQKCYIAAAGINIIISVICVKSHGLIGVAIGTLAAIFYQTLWMSVYVSNHLVKRQKRIFFKQIIVDIATAIIIYKATQGLHIDKLSYSSWIVLAIYVSVIGIAITIAINIIFNHTYVKKMAVFVIYIFNRKSLEL